MLEVKNLWKYYKKGIWVLKGIDFTIREGEIVALLGHNGAGKTTTMKCIMNLIFPQKGSIQILGIDSKNPDFKKYISYLPENAFIPPYYRVNEIIKIICDLRGLKWSEIEQEYLRLLEYFELTEYQNRYINELSKGSLQKVALLVSIIFPCKLYLWDEPAQNLDPVTRKKLGDFIKMQVKTGYSFLISSHILTEIERIATRAIILKQGEIVLDEHIENIIKKGKSLEDIYLKVHKCVE